MLELLTSLAAFGVLCWAGLLVLPWRPWSTRERLEAAPKSYDADMSDVTALVPARDEAETIALTLESLQHQGVDLHTIVIDDQSTDGTAQVIHRNFPGVRVLAGETLPQGWAGKLWALEQARALAQTEYVLLLDADITLRPGTLLALKQKMLQENCDLASLMSHLKMEHFWEKLLLPAFVYFFKLLYPFRLGNSATSRVGVAAGGCILLRRRCLDSIGGFGALKEALIDDCTLAKTFKKHGFRTWVGLSHSAISLRSYAKLGTIWQMVARSAYTQLHYSFFLLLGATLILTCMYVAPALTLSAHVGRGWPPLAAWLAFAAMVATYLPTLMYYRLSPLWALLLPITATLYLLMTWGSALRYYRGQRSFWKGRIYTTASAKTK